MDYQVKIPWKIVPKKDVPKNVTILGGTFVQEIKEERMPNEIRKA